MKLSRNFTLNELTRSGTAQRRGIDNEPTDAHLDNLQRIVDEILQPMREDLGPIRVTSGYRSPKLNRAIGGSSRSQHCKGEAVDIQFWEGGDMDNEVIYDYILDNEIEFDQMINEFDFSWIHISLKEKGNRNRVLEAYKNEEGKTCYREV
jgi:zinc D-Ala-D-Ala carboxypeptidase|tara:strand:+ start:1145 stop:1594 length:450 start_codon:yes stop_codon:yes gene_type:complete